MPRQARLDAPGTLHHIMLRGIARGTIVADDQDRAAFLRRLGVVAPATGTTIYAWALLPNHAHLLIRSGPQGLPRFMRRLLTGYALTYNRRHRRYGHLFQNRYKSIVVDADLDFQELVRYIHLNPLPAKRVPDLRALDRYPWCGHGGVRGRATPPWQDRAAVLASFGHPGHAASRAYRAFLRDDVAQGRRPELVGGGLIRSLGDGAAVRAIRQRGERVLTDARILGSGAFVERLLAGEADRRHTPHTRMRRLREAQGVIRQACRRTRISEEELRLGSRRRPLSALRAQLARGLVMQLGLSLADAARSLGVSTSGIAKVLARGGK